MSISTKAKAAVKKAMPQMIPRYEMAASRSRTKVPMHGEVLKQGAPKIPIATATLGTRFTGVWAWCRYDNVPLAAKIMCGGIYEYCGGTEFSSGVLYGARGVDRGPCSEQSFFARTPYTSNNNHPDLESLPDIAPYLRKGVHPQWVLCVALAEAVINNSSSTIIGRAVADSTTGRVGAALCTLGTDHRTIVAGNTEWGAGDSRIFKGRGVVIPTGVDGNGAVRTPWKYSTANAAKGVDFGNIDCHILGFQAYCNGSGLVTSDFPPNAGSFFTQRKEWRYH